MSCDSTIRLYNTPAFNILPVDQNGTAINISGAAIYVNFIKPNTDVTTVVTGVPFVSGSNVYIQYSPNSGFIDTVGRWSIYGTVIIGSGRHDTLEEHFKVRRL